MQVDEQMYIQKLESVEEWKHHQQEVLQAYHLQGYLMPTLLEQKFLPDSIYSTYSSGPLYEWLQLRPGNCPPKILLKTNYDSRVFNQKPFDMLRLNGLFEQILEEAEESGHPFAQVRLDSIGFQDQQISASLNFDLGPFISFDTLKITGSSKTDPIFLARSLQILPGASFSQKKINQAIRQIKNLPYLKLTGEPEISFQNSEATLYLPIDDRKINTLDGIIGFLPNEIEQNKMLVTGQFDLALYNVGGKGRSYQINWQRLSQLTQTLLVKAVEPMVLGSRINLGGSFYLLKEDSTFLNRDARIELNYPISASWQLAFFTRWQSGDLLSVSPQLEITELPEVADFRFTNYGFHVIHNGLDDLIMPRRGWFSDAEFGIGNKKILQNTAFPEAIYEGIELNTIQYYMRLALERHVYLRPQLGLFFRLSAGEMDNQNLLLNDLYRVGGLKSIRGFNENFFFTNRFAYFNFEPRFYFDAASYFMVFGDVARVENKVSGVPVDHPFSFGAGLNLDTGGGLFHFIYAVGKAESQPLGFNYSRIHFGFTGRF